MGNFISCTLMVPTTMNKNSRSRSVMVVFPGGEVRQLDGQTVITAAELMFECPNFFLTNSRSLHVGKRFSALSADEELEMGNLYVMFPMKRVNSIVKAGDMTPIHIMVADCGPGRASGRASNDQREMNQVDQGPESARDEAELFCAAQNYRHKLSACGSRKPLLETISEEPVWTR